jgi:DNA-binding transcriptional LysR family regulator
VLFVRTTRRVELTPSGSLLLERARRALSDFDWAIAEAQRSVQADEAVLGLGYGPFMRDVVVHIVEALGAGRPKLSVRLEQEVTPDSLRDEPLLAASPRSHRYASEGAIPIGESWQDRCCCRASRRDRCSTRGRAA